MSCCRHGSVKSAGLLSAIREFNAANTDSRDVPLHVEMVMCSSALEWLTRDHKAKGLQEAFGRLGRRFDRCVALAPARAEAETGRGSNMERRGRRNRIDSTRTLSRQSRLIETFKVLLRQLEDRAPAHLDITPYRNVISAQLTHIEMTYFFFIALGFSAESELRQLLSRSGVLKLMGAAKKSEIHTEMFKRYWSFDLRNSGVKREFPIPGHRIRQLTKHEKSIRARLPVPPRAKALPSSPLPGKDPVSPEDASIDPSLAADESLDGEDPERSELQAGVEAPESSTPGGHGDPGLDAHGNSDQG